MKKILAAVLAAVLCFGAACAAEPAAEIPDGTYEDASGISFVIPEGWNLLTEGETDISPILMFSPGGWDSGVYLEYTPADVWEGLRGKLEAMGYTREMLGPELMRNESFRSILMPDLSEDTVLEEHNGILFAVDRIRNDDEESGKTFYFTIARTWINAYFLMFQLITVGEPDEYLPDFDAWLDSVSCAK